MENEDIQAVLHQTITLLAEVAKETVALMNDNAHNYQAAYGAELRARADGIRQRVVNILEVADTIQPKQGL
jgi:hypothetical protein